VSLAGQLATLLGVFALGLVIRLLVSGVENVSYSAMLVLAGFGVSLAGIQPPLVLSHDVIMAVLLPTILFRGAVELDHDQFRENLLVPVVLVVVGLPLAVGLLGAVGVPAFGFPPIIALLFAAMIVPTDPAAVLSLFEELDAPERLSVIVDAESLFNDGVGVVVFGVVFELLRAERGHAVEELLSVGTVGELGSEFAVVGVGGLAVGVVAGYLGHHATRYVSDQMATVLLTVVLAYGSFLLAEHALGVSGILATVGSGLSMGLAGASFTAREEDGVADFVQSVWDTAGFLATTLIYVLVGAQIHPNALARSLGLVALAAVLVVIVRGIVVYGVVGTLNAVVDEGVPRSYQHVMVWGGLHTVVPVALVLSLPADVPFREDLRVMVFGIAVLGTVVQGLLMPFVLRRAGLVT
jgi:CPA1 family monovalent cation:H+ antiporter